jgi:hypothetical protein
MKQLTYIKIIIITKVVSPAGPKTKNVCAGEGQEKIARLEVVE